MNLSNPERLILIMLTEIYEHLGLKGEVDAAFVKHAIFSGNTWGISRRMSGLVSDERDESPLEVKEVSDILNMWQLLKRAYDSFDSAAKKRIEDEAHESDMNFPGFDGNNEAEHLGIGRFMTQHLDMYVETKVENSHTPTLDRYRRMLAKFQPYYPSVVSKRALSVDEIVEIMKT